STATGNFGSPNSGGYFYNQYMRLNYAYLTYKDPSGLYAKLGRFVEGGGPIGLAFADYFQGALLGFSQHGFNVYGAYSFNYTHGAAENAASGGQYQDILAHADYDVTPKFNVGVNYDLSRGISGETYFNSAYNPYAPAGSQSPTSPTYVACTTGQCGAWISAVYPLAVGSVNASYDFTPNFKVAAEFLHRFGKDPVGNTWKDNDSFWGEGTLGPTGAQRGNSYLEGGFISSGFNSNGPHTEIVGTPDYQQFYFSNPNGYNIGYVALHHWFSDNARVGVVFQGWGVKNGIDIPLGGGYFISKDSGTGVFLQTLISF
ncbi:MAG: hypothetical protein KGM44_07175, partial [bacterium]|nr:hypothetical protein [bacterium]